MINSKLKTISDIETNLLYSETPSLKNWYECEDDITEYKDFFFDELLFDLARPWPLGIKDCKYFTGTGDDREGEKDSNRWAFRGHGGTLSVENYPASLKNIKNIKVINEEGANIYDMLKFTYVIITSSSMKKIENRILDEKN